MSSSSAKRNCRDIAKFSNGSDMDSNGSKSDAKKFKVDDGPSKVVHLRNVPKNATEAEIIQLGVPFGEATNLLCMRMKNQAFLEMKDEEVAQRMVDHYSNNPPRILNQTVYLQLSRYKQLQTDNSTNSATNVKQALEVGNSMVTSKCSSVLHVTIVNMQYVVTLDVIHEIFTRIGPVLRIVTYTKNDVFYAMVEYPDIVTSHSAKLQLDGQNIYNNCCTLHIQFSKLPSLVIKYNNDKMRDYTNESDGPDGYAHSYSPSNLSAMPTSVIAHEQLSPSYGRHGNSHLNTSTLSRSNYTSSTPIPASLEASHLLRRSLSSLGHVYRQYTRSALGAASEIAVDSLSAYHHHHHQFEAPHHAADPYCVMDAYDRCYHSTGSLHAHAATAGGCVVLATNLNESRVTTDRLYNLFGCYGKVMRVKILFNKKNFALIQMDEPLQAENALMLLNGVEIWGREIRLHPSRYSTVQLPSRHEGSPGDDHEPDASSGAHLTKDYTHAQTHRPNSKRLFVTRPTAVLHLSNLSPQLTECDIEEVFEKNSYHLLAFKFLPRKHNSDEDDSSERNSRKQPNMALARLESESKGAEALMDLHNYIIHEMPMRVSFSKSIV